MTHQDLEHVEASGESLEITLSGGWRTEDGFEIYSAESLGFDVYTPYPGEPFWFAFAESLPEAIEKIERERQEGLFSLKLAVDVPISMV